MCNDKTRTIDLENSTGIEEEQDKVGENVGLDVSSTPVGKEHGT